MGRTMKYNTKKHMITKITIVGICMLLSLMVPGRPVHADDFIQKPVSAGSVNVTAAYRGQAQTGRKSDSKFVKAMANTSVRLLQEALRAKKKNQNVLISPDSVLTALSFVGNGASGKTRTEFKRTLGGLTPKKYSSYLLGLHRRIAKDDAVDYQVANSLWYRSGKIRLKEAFLRRAANDYEADIFAAPFDSGTINDINNWVYNGTRGKIPFIINRLDPLQRTAVINAVYFKGEWAEKYTGTRKRTFTKSSGSKQKVRMLEGSEKEYLTVNEAKGFVKDYAGRKLAFVALLPPKNTTVDQFVKNLNGSDLIKGYKNRKKEQVIVRTRMPEFSYEDSMSLEKPLRRMGLKTAFTARANFSKMANTSLQIDDVLHKTYISVDKNGTEAAAVTAVMMRAMAAPPLQKPEIKKVYLNRPFVYAIVEKKTGVPLFLGVVKKV
ncbi:MAG: serpin family protein [Eubacterium sp.]|nr:serpin family protein [Eubacterium sp.]